MVIGRLGITWHRASQSVLITALATVVWRRKFSHSQRTEEFLIQIQLDFFSSLLFRLRQMACSQTFFPHFHRLELCRSTIGAYLYVPRQSSIQDSAIYYHQCAVRAVTGLRSCPLDGTGRADRHVEPAIEIGRPTYWFGWRGGSNSKQENSACVRCSG